MKNKILILIAVLFSFAATAQKNVALTITHKLGTSPFAFNQATTNDLNNNLEFTRVDYYMSNIRIIHDGGMETASPNEHLYIRATTNHLADLGNLNVTNVEGIKFNIGVSPEVNTADPAQFTGLHPLAPKSPSMHWGWASGYRFAAVEGNGGPLLDQQFQFHSLFDANYFEQTVMVAGVNSGTDVYINLDADYREALKTIDVSTGAINHGDNTKDLTLLHNFRDHVFSAGQGFPTSVSNLDRSINLNVFPNPSTGMVHFVADNAAGVNITNAQIVDLSGRLIKEVSFANQNETDVHFDSKGIYFVKLYSYGVNVATRKVVIQ